MSGNFNNEVNDEEEPVEIEDVEVPYNVKSFGIPAGKAVIGILALIGAVIAVISFNAVYTPGNPSEVALGQRITKAYDPNQSFVSQDQPVPSEQTSSPEQSDQITQADVPEETEQSNESLEEPTSSGSIIPQRLIDAGTIPVPGDVGVLYLTFKSDGTVHINNTILDDYRGDSKVTMEDGKLVFKEVKRTGNEEGVLLFYALFDDPVLTITSKTQRFRDGVMYRHGSAYNDMHYMLK